jgi:hypothetical protein
MNRLNPGNPGGVALALLVAATCVLPVAATDAAPNGPAAGKPIDIALCLDTSNSMDGLIASAKVKLWDIVNDLAKVKPTPNLRVALYSYGNTGYDAHAGWVRKDLDLTTDLDELYQKLNALTTRGGTEYASRVCRDAVDQLQWSADKEALRIIFVCGNEPAGQDPVVSLQAAADKALAKGITINTIFCGPAASGDARDWKEFATLAGGKFANIDQARGAVAIATPMDKELAELSTRLSTTYLPYGREGQYRAANQLVQDANAAKLGKGAAAARAESKATGLYRNTAWDLVDRMKNDPQFDVKKLPEAELSDEMKKMKPEEREAYVKKMAAERDQLQKQIGDLSSKRQEYLQQEAKKNPSQADKAFDEAVRGALREQAAKKGIEIPK